MLSEKYETNTEKQENKKSNSVIQNINIWLSILLEKKKKPRQINKSINIFFISFNIKLTINKV